MIGTIASQAVCRVFCQTNFYSEIIERDGIELERHIPPRSFSSLHHRPVSTLANFSPVFAGSKDRTELERLCAEHPYQQFPLVTGGQLGGMIHRNDVSNGQSAEIIAGPAETIFPNSTIKEAVSKMVEESVSLLVVVSPHGNTPVGIITLHDILRLQNQLSEGVE
jgi:predicted transcriptional regulator